MLRGSSCYLKITSNVIRSSEDTYSKSPCTREWPNLKEAVAKLTVTGQEAATQAHQSVLTLGQREVNDTNIRVVQCADVQPKVNGVEMVQWVLAVSAAQECRSAARVLRKSKVLEAAGIPV